MPNFRAHRTLGLVVGFPISALLSLFTLVTTFAFDKAFFIGLIAYAATVAGSVAPDVDISRPRSSLRSSSIPYRGLVMYLRAVLVFVATVLVINLADITSVYGIAILVLGVVSAFYLVANLPDFLHRVMPKHRGITHNLVPWVIVAVAGTIWLRGLLVHVGATRFAVSYLPVAVAPPMAFGAFCHISLDIVDGLRKRVSKRIWS